MTQMANGRLERLDAALHQGMLVAALEEDAPSSSAICCHRRRQAHQQRGPPFVDPADPDMRHLDPGVQCFHAQTRHVSGLAVRSPPRHQGHVHPLLLAVCDVILGPSCARYKLDLAHLLERLPGAATSSGTGRDRLGPGPSPSPLRLASVVALVDFTADDGATHVSPEDPARRPALPQRQRRSPQMRQGHCLVPRITFHGGGAHDGTEPRRERPSSPTPSAGYGPRRTTTCHSSRPGPAPARRCQEVLGYAVHDAIERGRRYLGITRPA